MNPLVLLKACRRAVRERPLALRFGLIAATGALAGALLAAAGLGVLAQLVGGLALVPLALAIYICLLPPRPWRDEDGGGDFGGDGPLGGGLPPDGPTTVIDWAAFERQFWSYVEQHPLSTT